MSEQLELLPELVARMKRLRGSHQEWMEKSSQLLHFTAELPDSMRVLAKGEIHHRDFQAPAILIYDPVEQVVVKTVRNGVIETHPAKYFYSDINHASIAKEVLTRNEVRTVIVSDNASSKSSSPLGNWYI